MKDTFQIRPSRHPRTHRAGFTLVELLAVLAITGVLVALVTAGMQRARVAALRTECASNLRQIGMGVLLYAADHDGWLPPTTHSAGADFERAWIYGIAPYLDYFDDVRICPADPYAENRRRGGGTSYILNNIVFDAQYDPFGNLLNSYNNLRRLVFPSRTLFAGIIAESRRGSGVQNDHTHAESWDSGWSSFLMDIEPDRHRVGKSNSSRTSGSANYLFGDGHVQNIPASVMRERFASGENFARPPQD